MPVARETFEFDEGEGQFGAEHYVDSALLASIASGGTCQTFSRAAADRPLSSGPLLHPASPVVLVIVVVIVVVIA
jgi:hypothetical protein